MKSFALVFTLICIVHAENKTVSVALENGSFDEQTYGKDGVVLFYNYESEKVLASYMLASNKFENDKKINFWHINCDHAPEFCESRPKIQEVGIPSLLYSFRNELWEAQGVKTYKEHAFETFFNTKLQENCLNTPKLCSSVMNITLKEDGHLNHSAIKKLYMDEQDVGLELEKRWKEISDDIQRKWNLQRQKFVLELRNSDDRLIIYKLLMEKLHSEAYEKNEGETQQIVIDMRDKYLN